MNGTSASEQSVIDKGFIENIDQDAETFLKLVDIIQEVECVLQNMRSHKLYKTLPGSVAKT